jgi:phage terminase large subunit
MELLFQPARFKVMWGGRGGGRSWGCSRALLLMGIERPLRVLCVRELQKSMAESVHKVLSDQIDKLGLWGEYEIQRDHIIGIGQNNRGTLFSFEGIKNSPSKIKSYEGIDICWAEEAVKITRESWKILLPTIRKPGSEIWITFNPELEDDYTYTRFVVKADARMLVAKMDWRDNPWFPEELRRDMEADKAEDYDEYLHIWEGHCVQELKGAIYAKQLRKATEDGRICRVPYDRDVPVSTFWDLGRADNTAIWFAQRVAMQWRLLEYYENSGEDIDHYIKECQRKEYIYDTMYLPHDSTATRLGMPKSIRRVIADHGFKTRVVPKLPVTDGINAARLIFPSCWFDEERCQQGLQRLRHYKYEVVDGHLSDKPLHDDASDGSDAFRYFAVSSKRPLTPAAEIKERLQAAVDALRGESKVEEFSGRGRGPRSSTQGWMG